MSNSVRAMFQFKFIKRYYLLRFAGDARSTGSQNIQGVFEPMVSSMYKTFPNITKTKKKHNHSFFLLGKLLYKKNLHENIRSSNRRNEQESTGSFSQSRCYKHCFNF